MSRPSKGARIWLRKARLDKDGRIRKRAQWVILDGGREYGTRFGPEDCTNAADERLQQALAEHIAEKYEPARRSRRHPSQVLIADVIAIYLTDRAPHHARPEETALRCAALLGHFGTKTLEELDGAACRAYAASRSSPAAARRELEDLRAAIRYHHREGLCTEERKVVLPEKGVARDRWLTRSEAAALIRAAWRYREVQKGTATDRHPRRHVARFALVALYTGTRAGLICAAAFEPTPGRGWIDLDTGLFHRKPTGARVTKKRAPTIRLPDQLLAHIRRWKDKCVSKCFVVEFNGKPLARLGKAFRAVTKDAGLPIMGPDKVTPHTLRHTAATWQMQSGTDAWQAGGYLGMSPETLIRIYGHHHPDHMEQARTAFGRMKRRAARPMNGPRKPETEQEHTKEDVTDIGGIPPKSHRA